MLIVTPISVYDTFSLVQVQNNFNWAFVHRREDFDPYKFSFDVSQGKSWYTGDKDCTHLQVHGKAVIDDINCIESWERAYSPPPFCLDEVPLIRFDSGEKVPVGVIIDPALASGYASQRIEYLGKKKNFHFPWGYFIGVRGDISIFVNAKPVIYTVVTSSSFRIGWRVTVYFAQWDDASSQHYREDTGAVPRPWVTDDMVHLSYPYYWALSRVCQPDKWSQPWFECHLGYSPDIERSQAAVEAWIEESYALLDATARELCESIFTVALNRLSKGTRYKYQPHYLRRQTGHYLSSSSLSHLRRQIYHDLQGSMPELDRTVLLSNATQAAADSAVSFDGNTAVLLKEIKELRNTFSALVDMAKGEADLKGLANAWLSARYGLRLTLRDVVEILSAISSELKKVNNLYSRSRGGAQDDQQSAFCKLYYAPRENPALVQFLYNAQRWDFFPSLENVWDFIPYSFVLDWFVDVSGFLKDIDTRTFLSTCNVFLAQYSYKVNWDFSQLAATHGIIGTVKGSYYERWSQPEPQAVIPTFSGSLPSYKNIIDGAALIIQRR